MGALVKNNVTTNGKFTYTEGNYELRGNFVLAEDEKLNAVNNGDVLKTVDGGKVHIGYFNIYTNGDKLKTNFNDMDIEEYAPVSLVVKNLIEALDIEEEA